jgi:hypothetical protein
MHTFPKIAVALVAACCLAPAASAQEKKLDTEAMVSKGLEWLKRTQKPDGSWSTNGTYPTTMTALAGMAMLMEGSTLREGKYSDNLVKAVDWFLKVSQSNGLLGNPNNPTESSRYIYGHGFGMLFLASVYGEEEDAGRRKKLEAVLKKAVEFSCKAVTTKGGWGYVSGKDGGDFDEGSTTITQMQGLRAARNAGIVVPKGTIDNAVKYLEKCTTPRGGVIYNYQPGAVQAGAERPPITAAAVACSFSAGGYDNEYAKKWLKFCKDNIYLKGRINGHDEYQSYYFGQAVYILGDDRYAKLFPGEKDGMTWTEYKKSMFEHYRSTQGSDGSWSGGYAGPELATSFALTILQLDKATLPIYHR